MHAALKIVAFAFVLMLAACETTTAPPTTASPAAKSDSGVMAVMKIGPEFVMLYDTRLMSKEGSKTFAVRYCAARGQKFGSIVHRPMAHPSELPNAAKAAFKCA